MPEHPAAPSGPTDRYEDLLTERVRLGRTCVDYAVHREVTATSVSLRRDAHRVERQLIRFDRYRWDHFLVVAAAEDARWHVPGELVDCDLCIRGVDVFLAQLAPVLGDS
jgi:hypothetical protein